MIMMYTINTTTSFYDIYIKTKQQYDEQSESDTESECTSLT